MRLKQQPRLNLGLACPELCRRGRPGLGFPHGILFQCFHTHRISLRRKRRPPYINMYTRLGAEGSTSVCGGRTLILQAPNLSIQNLCCLFHPPPKTFLSRAIDKRNNLHTISTNQVPPPS